MPRRFGCRPRVYIGRQTLLDLQQNVPLAPLTTLGVGGPARWFATARSEADVADAVRFAREHLHAPLFLLGGGSNLLVTDAGFPGLVLHMQLPGIDLKTGQDRTLLHVGAGVPWEDLVQFAVSRDLAGIECLAGIPGTTGATPVQNVGAYGQEVSQTITRLRCLDTLTLEVVELSNADCGFAYRTSRFNGADRDRYIVLRVDFALQPGGAPNLSYADLRRAFDGKPQPTLSAVAEVVRTIRRAKGMVVDAADPDSHSAGSFFRNPIVPAEALARIAKASSLTEEEVPHWPAPNGQVKLAAAWLLEHAGFTRGTTRGPAAISGKHTLALTNRGGATQADIVALRDEIIRTVQATFGITLEQEPVNVG